jgi:hypothetical protein
MTTETIARHGVALPKLCGANGTVFCLATGPSLNARDVAAVRDRGVVVAVNDAHTLAPWADVLYSSDRYWWGHHRGVDKFPGLKATIEYSPKRYAKELLRWAPEMFFLRNTGHHGVEIDPTGIRTCGQNSGGAAVNLAVHLGARRIVLLGYNMGVPGEKRHFFGDHPRALSNTHNFPTWRAAFDTMAAPLKSLGIDVVNCTENTSLSSFRCAPLAEVLA